MRKNKGITLIALIVTIIVLLILAGIGISMLVGENGILNKSKLAKENSDAAGQEEENRLSKNNEMIEKYTTSRGDTSITSASPDLLTSIALPSSNASSRAGGTYNGSTSSYTKTNGTRFENYLSYEDGKGWTVLKSGNYLFNAIVGSVRYSSDTGVYSFIKINSNSIEITNHYLNSSNIVGNDCGNITIYLEQGDVIDYQYSFNAATTWNYATLNIYSLFK